MSLIKCPECGRQVSSKAPCCPGCGVPILNNVKRCPVCGELALMDAEQCPHCEARFVVEKTACTNNANSLPNPDYEEDELLDERDERTESEATENGTASEAEEPSTTTPPAKPKKDASPWWIALGILLVAVAGFFYYEHMQHEATEEKDFARLQDCMELANFQDFLNRYPNSRHLENVKARMEALEAMDKDWAEVCNSSSTEQLQQFIDKYPNALQKKAALRKIDSLDWREADRQGTAAAYALYIGRHENGIYIDMAYVARDEAARREQLARQDSLNALMAAADSVAIAGGGVPAAE